MAGTEFPERARLDNPNGAQVVQRNLDFLRDKFDGYSIPLATPTVPGGIQLAGDLAGSSSSPQIAAGVITDAEVAVGAAIKGSKLAMNIGTSPPGSPTTGDIWIYPGSGFYWMFIYDNAEATYKWKFVGGGPLSAVVATDQTFTAGVSFVDPATPGPTVTVPRAGDYNVMAQCQEYIASQTAAGTPEVAVVASSGLSESNASANCQAQEHASVSGGATSIPVNDIVRGMSANATLKMQYRAGTAMGGTPHCRWRELKVFPIRVI